MVSVHLEKPIYAQLHLSEVSSKLLQAKTQTQVMITVKKNCIELFLCFATGNCVDRCKCDNVLYLVPASI